MIKLEDLRINNYYMHENGSIVKLDMRMMRAFTGFEAYKVEDLRGIPLTTKLITDIGFVDLGLPISIPKHEGGYGFCDDFVLMRKIGIEDIWCIAVEDLYEKGFAALRDIQYLHQLQNIYYACREKELPIPENMRR